MRCDSAANKSRFGHYRCYTACHFRAEWRPPRTGGHRRCGATHVWCDDHDRADELSRC